MTNEELTSEIASAQEEIETWASERIESCRLEGRDIWLERIQKAEIISEK